MYRAAGIEAAQKGETLEEAQQEFRAQYGDIQFVEDRERFEQSLRDYQWIASRELFSAPLLLAKQTVAGCGKLLLGPGTRALDTSLNQAEPSAKWWPSIYSAALLVVLLLSLVGVKRLGVEALVPLLLVVYFVCLASGPESNSRFRVPITPLLAVLPLRVPTERKNRNEVRNIHNGTDTGVGKTHVTAALLTELRRRGVSAAASNPLLAGQGGDTTRKSTPRS